MSRVALLVLCVFVLGISCEYVGFPYTFQTQYQLRNNKIASWTIGADNDFNLSGSLNTANNVAALLFSAEIEGQEGLSTTAFRTGSIFEIPTRSFTESTSLNSVYDVTASIYVVTHSPIARYFLTFTPRIQDIVPPTETTRDLTNFDVFFDSPQFDPAVWSIITTSSGDNVLSTGDNWVIIQEDNPIDSENPTGYTLIYLYQAVTGTERPTDINFSTDDLTFSFSVPIQTGETKSLMFFVELSDNLNELVAGVSKYDQTFDFPPLLIADIPKTELDKIVNFQFVDPVNGVPLPATFTNLCKISSEIRDRSSARHPTKKHYFQQPWFC